MDHQDAVSLVRDGVVPSPAMEWADLGAGSGVFTRALADLLQGTGSTIYAVDKDAAALAKMGDTRGDVTITRRTLDFVADDLPLPVLDGILIANALHFVREQSSFIQRLRTILKADGSLLIIEYDTDTANQWVPYPVSFTRLKELMKAQGFQRVVKLAELPSLYSRANIYSALVR
jgi:ubiquinone/menaquinone biosynthesis C-methylase UbiE